MTAHDAAAELHELIRSKISDDMTADQAARAVMTLFRDIRDDHDEIDITAMGDGPPGTKIFHQRRIVAQVFRDSRVEIRAIDRSVD